MASTVDICNMALNQIGASMITSLEDNNQKAELCRLYYPQGRRAVLEAHQWTFATERFVLDAYLVDEPKWGDYKAYPLPNPETILVVQRVYSDIYEDRQIRDWKLEGENILAGEGGDENQLYVRITRDIEDTTKFSAGFVESLAARIAAQLAIPIQNSRELHNDLWGVYNSKLADAVSNDGSQGFNERILPGNLTRVRRR